MADIFYLLERARVQYRNTFLYKMHYKLLHLFEDSHISRINFFTGAFLFLQSIAEPAWKEYTLWAKLALAPAWVFLLIILSVFIVPTAGSLPAIFATAYKHLFSSKARLRTIIIFLLYVGSAGLLVAGLFSNGLMARAFVYASLFVLPACMVVHALLGDSLTTVATLILLLITGCVYTWLYLTAKGVIHYGGFYGVLIVFSATLIGLLLSMFKKFRD